MLNEYSFIFAQNMHFENNDTFTIYKEINMAI